MMLGKWTNHLGTEKRERKYSKTKIGFLELGMFTDMLTVRDILGYPVGSKIKA